MRLRKLARLNDIKEGKGSLARVNGEEIALFKIRGEFFAIGNVCPHQHFSLLYEGELRDFTVTCPMHGWSYDVRTGISTNASGRVKSFSVVVQGEELFIRSDDDTD